MLRFLKYLVITSAFLAILALAGAGTALYYMVVVNPGPEIEESNIEKILGRESPVFYRDGQEKIGVLFQGVHRQYLTYDQIPRDFVNAIVAAEDDQFFHHHGIDFPGIVRAMIANIRAGRVVQGGSTITQQTAKNLFKRESRSYRAKLKELLYALRLEYRYPKEKILEFYSNQFFVSGNGHGLGVAARYYFDKDPEDLTLVECAFIAGSVKRPNYYNPFTKRNRNRPEVVRKRARERVTYVLGKMLKNGMISQSRYQEAMTTDLVFRQGRMAFALNTVMDLVKDDLASPAIADALEEHGISNVSTSGVRIITSVDHDLQQSALYALRRDLSRLDVRLRGYERDQVQKEYAALTYSGDSELARRSFLFGTIAGIEADARQGPRIRVNLGDKRPVGIIDRQGLERLVTALARYRDQRWTRASEKDVSYLLQQLAEGDRVYVSVRELDADGTPSLDLERFPRVQGAALVVRQGAILAMAGGMENRYFNRAIDARRLMGSTFKPFLFAAALQLGWNTTDPLDNRRNVFVFMDRPYFPRPDHHSPFASVSMSWAGVTSENVAAVWLLYHLADQLTPPRLREVAARLDMAPRTTEDGEESYSRFKGRIRDRFGIVVNRDTLRQAAYDRAVQLLEADFLFEDRAGEYRELRDLPFGLHFDRFIDEISEQLEQKDLKKRERQELLFRRRLLRANFLALEPVQRAFFRMPLYFDQLRRHEEDLFSFFRSWHPPDRPPGAFFRDGQGRVVFTLARQPEDDWYPLDDRRLLDRLLQMDRDERQRFWGRVRLDGLLSVDAYGQVNAQMARELASLAGKKPYSMEVLAEVRDYRVMVGLQYLVRLARETGIGSRLEPVLSFPLGSNVVTLAEAVRMYETLVTGFRTDSRASVGNGEDAGGSSGNNGRHGLDIIDRIEAPGGRVVYSRQVAATRVFDPGTSAAIANVLQNVVEYGTGRLATSRVRLHSDDPQREKALAGLDIAPPLLGKTGTANRFRNAAFLGFVPVLSGDDSSTMTLDGGYTVGTYVGYDNNVPMVRGTTHITGATGALPAWCDIAATLLQRDHAGDRVDPVDLTFNGLRLRYPDTGELFVAVDPDQGGLVLAGRGARQTTVPPSSPVVLTYGRVVENGVFEPARFFRPFWRNLRQEQQQAAAPAGTAGTDTD
ncbi:transglycosylase domain-containing protein [Thermodesulfobacteriota bacterium B35]